MGSMSQRSLQELLRCSPGWSESRQVVVERGPTGKLGFVFKTYQDGIFSLTVVCKVRESCCVRSGYLRPCNRILAINGFTLSPLSEEDILSILSDPRQSVYSLKVQSLLISVGTTLSSTMSASNSTSNCKRNLSTSVSSKSSVESVEQLKGSNKRLAKSKSIDQEKSPAVSQNYLLSQEKSPPVVSVGRNNPPVPTAVPLPTHHQWDSRGLEKSYICKHVSSVPCDVGLEQIVCELGQVYSLPPSVNAGDCNFVGGKDTTSSQLDLEPCCLPQCDGLQCLWHSSVIKYPQYVIWDPHTKKITLEKGSEHSFGLHKKVKVHSSDSEVYVLIDRIEKGMAAAGHLQIGDWIRSVNGNALQTGKQAFSYDFDKYNVLQLIIQRPCGFSKQASTHIKVPKFLQPLKIPLSKSISRQDSRTTPSPSGASSRSSSYQDSRSTPSPGSKSSGSMHQISSVKSFSPQSSYRMTHSPRVSGLSSGSSSASACGKCKSCGREITSPDSVFETLPSFLMSSSDNNVSGPCIQNSGNSSWTQRDSGILKVRVFICGNSAIDLANHLLQGQPTEVHIAGDSHIHCSEHMIQQNEDSQVIFEPWQPNTTFLSRDLSAETKTNNSVQCLKCPRTPQCAKMELFVLPDENFFHHCSQFLFTKNSLFLVAFDAYKLLNSPRSEIPRLVNILHTLCCFSGLNQRPHLYGLLNADTVKACEVRTLFYTYHGNQLRKYCVSIPDIAFLPKYSDSECVGGELRRSVLDLAISGTSNVKISQMTASLSSTLKANGDAAHKTVWTSSELMTLCPQFGGNMCAWDGVIQELSEADDLILVKARCSLTNRRQQEYVFPRNLVSRLATLILGSDFEADDGAIGYQVPKPSWIKLLTTATVSHSDLLVLLEDIVTDAKQFISCLEQLDILFPLADVNSERNYLIPYFLSDMQPAAVSSVATTQDSPLELFVVFKKLSPWTLFYNMVSQLDQIPACGEVSLSNLNTCTVQLNKLSLRFEFQKTENRIRIVISRGGNPVKKPMILQVMRGVLDLVVAPNYDYIIGPSCPLDDGNHDAGHVLNLGQATIFCGHIPLSDHEKVKPWLVADTAVGANSISENSTDSSKHCMLSKSIMKLPYSVFNQISLKLNISSANDWKNLAAHLGKTMEYVMLFNSHEDPAMDFLVEWGHYDDGTIGQLLAAVTEMDRQDVIDILTLHLQS